MPLRFQLVSKGQRAAQIYRLVSHYMHAAVSHVPQAGTWPAVASWPWLKVCWCRVMIGHTGAYSEGPSHTSAQMHVSALYRKHPARPALLPSALLERCQGIASCGEPCCSAKLDALTLPRVELNKAAAHRPSICNKHEDRAAHGLA
jgi:hypothetical protein